MDAKLPDKQYMKIGEVSRLTSLNSSVLRFWETEFSQLRPLKSRSGQRLYTRENLELILSIRHLLYQEKLTIAGARNRIEKSVAAPKNAAIDEGADLAKCTLLKELQQDLSDLRKLLG